MTKLFGFVLSILIFTACTQADPTSIPTEESTEVAQFEEIKPTSKAEIASTPIPTAAERNEALALCDCRACFFFTRGC